MKTINSTLLAHKASSSTTLTDLLLIGPLDDDTYRGLTLLDIDVAYNDTGGLIAPTRTAGSVTYKARTGFEMSALQSSADLGVDNAEATTLYPIATFEIEGFTQAQIDAGALDKAPFVVYRVNYKDLTAGRHEVIAAGTVGEVRTKFGQLSTIELRSLSQQLKQEIVELDSITCRAKFGSQPIGTGGGVVEERFPCGFDLSSSWVSGTVLALGSEDDTEFTDTGLTQDDDFFAPGVVRWLTGTNAGQQQEVEQFGSGAIVLQFPTVNPIQLGDTFEIRPDCTKNVDGLNGCRDHWGAEWGLHYRGEPWIPVGDSAGLTTPGAGTNIGGIAGTGETGTDTEGGGVDPGGIPPSTTPSRTRGTTVLTVSASLGDGVTDVTDDIQAVIDALPGDGGTVVIPNGTYMIDITKSVKPVSNMHLQLSSGTVLQAISNNTVERAYVVWCDQVDQVEISGGKIRGDLDTYAPLVGSTSEWRHGIAIYGCTGITVRDITVTRCVGDAVSAGSHLTGPSSDIVVRNVKGTYSRRQGISLGSVSVVRVIDSEFGYIGTIHGTLPMAGIDIEPLGGNTATDILITNTKFHHCNKSGAEVTDTGGAVSGAVFDSCQFIDNYGSGTAINGDAVGVEYNACEIERNGAEGMYLNNSVAVTVDDCTFGPNYTRHGVINRDPAVDLAGISGVSSRDIHVLNSSPTSGIGTNHYQ